MNRLINSSSGTTPTSSATTAQLPIRVGKRVTLCTIGTICLLVAAGLVFAGCGKGAKEPTITEAATNAANPDASAVEQEKLRIERLVAIRQGGNEPPAPALKLRGGEVATPEVLAAYNQELLRLIFKEREAPETLEELMRKKTMPRLPTPPPGKRIVYDDRNHIIRLDPP